MSVFLSFTVLGIVLGAIYGILATGLVVTYNTTGVFNFAQGAVGMVAAFSYWQLWQDWHWPFLLAIVVIVFIEAPLLAIVVEFVLFRRIHGATVERSLMVTLGLLVILLGVATIFWSSPDVIRSVPSYFTQSDGTVLSVHLFGSNGVTIQYQQIMFVVVAAVVSIGLGLFLRRFRLGVAMRAVVDDPAARGHGRRQAVPHVAGRLGPRLHAGRPGRRAAGPGDRADRPDGGPAHPAGPERLRRRRGRAACAACP